MDGPGYAVLPIPQQHGHAVGHHAEDGQTLHVGDDTVGLVGDGAHTYMPVFLRDDADKVAVDLFGDGHIVDAHAHEGAETAVIFPHRRRVIPPVGAQVQGSEVPPADAAIAGGEGVAGGYDVGAHVDEPVLVVFCKTHGFSGYCNMVRGAA